MALRRMRSIPWGTGALVLAALAAAGCQQNKESGGGTPATPAAQSAAATRGEVVATYQGHTLTSGRVALELERLPPRRAPTWRRRSANGSSSRTWS